MTETIAVFNQSGGVGKSTLTMNLGYQLTCKGQRVLLVDIDPQASLTIFMGLDPWELKKTIYHAIVELEPLPTQIQHGITICPSNIDLAGAEIELLNDGMRDTRLKNALSLVQDDYDFILIDCPPSLGVLAAISLHAATHVLIPVQTEYKAWMGTDLLLNTIAKIRQRSNPALKIKGFIPTLFNKGNTQHRRALEAIQNDLAQAGQVFPAVSDRTAFVNASERHLPLAVFAPKNDAVEILDQICDQMMAKEVAHV